MKNLFITACILFCSTIVAQEEWGDVKGSTFTFKEISPVWPGCEKGNAAERDHCFNQQLSAHISRNFKYPAEASEKKDQGRVTVEFLINEAGLVEVISVSGGSKALQAEAKRNILTIPKMTKPGMLAGKPRAIKMIVPFTFKTGK